MPRSPAPRASRRRSPSTPAAAIPAPRLPADRLFFGGDYNPEQWPEATWQEDVRLMREAGVNLVSVGIFSWAMLQPTPRRWDFAWLDRLLDLLAANGVGVCLATATASPPAWMARLDPLSVAVTADGVPLAPGGRQHYSPFSATYRRHAAELVRRLAARYGRHPALVAWHVNNEYACHVQECHGPEATEGFRAWLRAKYGTLDALNAAWSTAFWSQRYGDWDEIPTPRRTAAQCNPCQQLDYKRCFDATVLGLHRMELDLLREATPGVPVTTNFMWPHKPVDQRAWAPFLDFASWDSYPDPALGPEAEVSAAYGHERIRSLRRDRPWLLMESVTTQVNWRRINPIKRPGILRLQSLQAVAHGSDGALFFQWRAGLGGGEKFHGALVPHVGTRESRVWREVCGLGADLGRLAPVAGTVVEPSKVAILLDNDAWWALELDSKPARFDYVERLGDFHREFHARNVRVDFVHPGDPLDGYALVVAPTLYLLRKGHAEAIGRHVEAGGTFLATTFTGIVDENERIVPGGYPAYLREVLGMWVEEFDPYPEGARNGLRWKGVKGEVPCEHWSDVIHLEGAEAVATYVRDYYAGRPAITRNARGKGTAWYLGTRLGREHLGVLVDQLLAAAGVAAPLAAPEGVEVVVRAGEQGRFLFLLNHRDHPAAVKLGKLAGTDLLSGATLAGVAKLGPRGAAVIRLG